VQLPFGPAFLRVFGLLGVTKQRRRKLNGAELTWA
jgi:hypothetical protein